MKNSNKILAQGLLDGLCLPYSVLNEYKALYFPQETSVEFAHRLNDGRAIWKKIVSSLPSLQNFCNGKGTCMEDIFPDTVTVELEAVIVQTIASILNSSRKHHIKVEKIDVRVNLDERDPIQLFRKNIGENSVVILSIRKTSNKQSPIPFELDHWLCAVDIVEEGLGLACSYTPIFQSKEMSSPSGRSYNTCLHKNDLLGRNNKISFKHFFDNSLYRISRA